MYFVSKQLEIRNFSEALTVMLCQELSRESLELDARLDEQRIVVFNSLIVLGGAHCLNVITRIVNLAGADVRR